MRLLVLQSRVFWGFLQEPFSIPTMHFHGSLPACGRNRQLQAELFILRVFYAPACSCFCLSSSSLVCQELQDCFHQRPKPTVADVFSPSGTQISLCVCVLTLVESPLLRFKISKLKIQWMLKLISVFLRWNNRLWHFTWWMTDKNFLLTPSKPLVCASSLCLWGVNDRCSPLCASNEITNPNSPAMLATSKKCIQAEIHIWILKMLKIYF